MKIFGLGKSKAPQSQTVQQQVKNTDPRIRNHVRDRGKDTRPCKTSNTRKQQGLFDVEDDTYILGAKAASHNTDDKNLQDRIRFVFSLEQEFLLTIGTLALEQLATIHDSRHHHKPASDGFQSCANLMQDYVNFPSEFPSDVIELKEQDTRVVNPKALTLCQGNDRSPVAGTKHTGVLTPLPPELRRALDPLVATPWFHRKSLSFVPLGHWTDSTPPPQVVLPKANGDEEYYSSYFCGLFSSKKRSSLSEKTKRMSLPKRFAPTAQELENFECSTETADQKTKKSRRNVGTSRGLSLENLAKLWRSSCLHSNARIAPERKPCSPYVSQAFEGAASRAIKSGEVLTTPVTLPLDPCDNRRRQSDTLPSEHCSPKGTELRRRDAMPAMSVGNDAEVRSDGENEGGHWIKTDSEYVVLEM